jgi:tRNA threonylcarbamoyladenosine biosynthesis protein TsaE
VSAGVPRITRSVAQTEALGASLAPALAVGDVVALSGELGAGKTRFVSGLARVLAPGSRVRSPSFTLVNEYAGSLPLFHLDLYRLATGDVDGLGLEEYAARGVLVVEWGERLPGSWLEDALRLEFTAGEDDARSIAAAASGARSRELLAAWSATPELS